MRGFNNGWASGGYGSGFGVPWSGLVLGLIGIALIVLLIITLVRLGKTGTVAKGGAGDTGKALEILAERFARGELDAETFRGMKAEIEK